MAGQLRAGAARAIITPPVGITHVIWGAQTHTRAVDVDLDLWATALVLADDDQTIVVVDLDLVFTSDDLAATIRNAIQAATGIPTDHVRIHCTHTHSGPTLGPTWVDDGQEIVAAYVAHLPHQIAGAVLAAQRVMRPARAATGVGHSEINVNRRRRTETGRVVGGCHWKGFVDHTVGVVRIDDIDERPIATIIHFGAHPIIMGHPNKLITPDYPGVAKRVVEQQLGGYCLFMQGCSGDTMPIRQYSDDVRLYRRLGSILGLEAAKVALSLDTLPRREHILGVLESGSPLTLYADQPAGEPDCSLDILTRTIDLAVQDFGDPAAHRAEYESCRAMLAQVLRTGDEQRIQGAVMKTSRASAQLRRAEWVWQKSTFAVSVQAFRIGQTAFIGFPGEPFAAIGAEVRQRSPFPQTFMSGLTNGYAGYVPTPEEHPAGGYEVFTTPYRPEAAPKLVEKCLALLNDLHAEQTIGR